MGFLTRIFVGPAFGFSDYISKDVFLKLFKLQG